MAPFPKYAFEAGQVLAFYGDTLIAKGDDFDKVSKLADEYCAEVARTHEANKREEARRTATHITTPNGIKGTIISSHDALWSEEITVRMENGEIRHFHTASNDGWKYSTETPEAPKSYREYFERRLEQLAGHESDLPGLTARLNDLTKIRNEAAHLASKASHTEQQDLHNIILTAEAEKEEVKEAVAYLEASDAEAMRPPAPFEMRASEQASMGRAANDSWLDVVASDMIAESEAEDFTKLMNEGPTIFASSLEMPALSSQATTHELAAAHIHAKTAGFHGETVEKYREQFVAATEMARRQELSLRQDVQHKEAATKEAAVEDAPDSALFL